MFTRLAFLAFAAALCLPTTGWAQGMLIPTDDAVTPLTLHSHRVEFEVDENAAVTHVTQVFANHTSRDLEATYYFAVPDGATTTEFALWMNGERIEGEVLPRDQARNAYETIVRRMRDPGLLEYVDGDLFQASIYPVPANGTQTVEIEFASVLPRDGTDLRYVYPMHASVGQTVRELVISGDVRAGAEINRVYAPHHDVETIYSDRRRHARVSMEQLGASTNEDFELFIGRSREDVGFSMLVHDEDDGEPGWFMMTLTPSEQLEDLEALPRQVTFVVDTSGSMAGIKIEQAQSTLRHAIENLNDEDTFQIIGFSSAVNPAFDEPTAMSRSSRREALDYVDNLRARGNTNISEALDRALEDPASPDRPHLIFFITDGLPTEGDTNVENIIDIARIGASDGDRRVFAFGVGYDVNTRLLDGVARRGRGESGYVRPNEDISDVVGEFYDRMRAPLLTQLELDFGNVDVAQVYPNPLPDLYRGGEITLFGRFDGRTSEALTVSGYAGRERITMTFAPDWSIDDTDKSFIANLWARRRVDALLDDIEESGSDNGRVQEVIELATSWNIVTPYTSYLAMEPSQRVNAGLDPAPVDRTTASRNRGWGGAEGDAFAADDMDMGGEIAGNMWGGTTGASSTATGMGSTGSLGSRGLGQGGGGAAPGRPMTAMPEAEPMPSMDEEERWGGTEQQAWGAAPPVEPIVTATPAPRAQTGRDAVEESIRRNEDANTTRVDNSAALRRSASGRGFGIASGGVWVEDGLEAAGVDVYVDYMSDAWFALAAESDLGDVLALGPRVRFEHEGRVYEVR